MKKITARIAALALAIAMMAMTACSAQDTGSSAAQSAQSAQSTSPAQQTTIRYMTWEDSDWQKLTTDFIKDFEAKNPDIKIRL